MFEIWKSIPGFEEYAISSLGSVKRTVPDKYGRPYGQKLSVTTDKYGYLRVGLFRNKKVNTMAVHKLQCLAFHGEPPSDIHQAAHFDGVKTNNTPNNVKWATPTENSNHKHNHGTMLIGSKNKRAIITEEIALQIYNDNRVCRIIANELGIGHNIVSKIKCGRTWKHIRRD